MVLTRRVTAIVAPSILLIGAVTFLIWSLSGFGQERVAMEMSSTSSLSSQGRNDMTLSATHRKLLLSENAIVKPDRIAGDKCTEADILIRQGPTGPLPRGIPSYTVSITNACVSGCNISRIHLSCGLFSSATLINPKLFKRLSYGDCLVNDGEPLMNGGTIHFQYSNTFPYPLSVSSLLC